MSAESAPAEPPISVSIEDGSVVVKLAGELDAGNSDALPAAIMAATSETDAPVLIDIGDVTFLDSSFLRVIILCGQALEAEGRTVRVRNASDQARRTFEITHLTDLLEA
jgi:anti-anti-sigma factor